MIEIIPNTEAKIKVFQKKVKGLINLLNLTFIHGLNNVLHTGIKLYTVEQPAHIYIHSCSLSL